MFLVTHKCRVVRWEVLVKVIVCAVAKITTQSAVCCCTIAIGNIFQPCSFEMGALFSSLLHFRSVMIVFILCLWFFFLHSTSTSYAFSYFGTETALKHTYRENSSLWSPWIFAFHMKTFPFASFYTSSLRKCAIYMQNDYRYSLWLCRICAVMWYNVIHARILQHDNHISLRIFPCVASHFGDCFFTDKNMVYNTPCIWWNYLFNVRKVLFLEPVT